MAEPDLHDLIRYVHRLAGQADGALSDTELLTRFVERRDDAAFESLVWRHGQLIWGVCQRLLRNRQDTEDAFQATFLVFARKARSVRERDAVGGWLYQVAQRIALELRRKNDAVKTVSLVDSLGAAQLEDTERVDLRRTLEEEIACLPTRYRLPAFLRYLEGKSTAETAAILGCPPGTVLSRLAWVRRRLRARLSNRGVRLALLLSAATASEATASAPIQCVLATVAAALTFDSLNAAKAGRSFLLAHGVLRAMLMTKLTAGSFALLGLVTIAAGIGLAVWQGPKNEGEFAATEEQPAVQVAQTAGQETGQTKPDKSVPSKAQDKAAAQEPDLPEVLFVRPLVRNLHEHFDFTGRTEAAQTVTIRPRISSTLEKVDVKPGALVKQGDLLFQLDASIVRAEYDKAAGEFKRAQAQLEQAKTNQAIIKQQMAANVRLVDVREVGTAGTKTAEAQASMLAAQAGVNRAQIEVDATRITAPIAGRIGRIEIDVGNVVGPTTKLTTLVSLSPIYVSFNIDEATFRILQKYLQKTNADKPIQVEMKLSGDARPERRGVLDSIDNSFDPNTGTVRARAKFPNEQEEVLPGMFAQVQLIWGEPKETMLIPDKCISTSNGVKYVFAITPENFVETRFVTIGKLEPDGRVILDGLTPKDRVMVRIADNKGEPVGAESRVRATEAKAAKPGGR